MSEDSGNNLDHTFESYLQYTKPPLKQQHSRIRRQLERELEDLIKRTDTDELINWYVRALWARGDDHKNILSYIVEVLKRADVDLIQSIIKLFNRDMEAAICGLGEFGHPEQVPELIKYLNNNNSRIREATARSIGKIGDSSVVNKIIPRLDDCNPFVQQTAIEALGKLGGSNAVDALVKKIKNNNPYIRLEVIKALNKIANRGSGDESCSEKVSSQKRLNPNIERVGRDIFLNAIEPLIDIMKRDLPEYQIAAIDALGKIGLSRAIDPLLAMLSSENEDIKKSVISAIGKICNARIDERYFEAIENTQKPIEEAFLEAYKEIDIKLLIETLTPFVSYPDSGIRLATSATLSAIGSPISISILEEYAGLLTALKAK